MKTLKLEFSKNGFIKRTVLLCAFGVATVFTISCSKDDDPAPLPPVVIAPLQDPLTGYLAASGFSEKTINNINGGDYEFGYSFIPLVNGKMTAINAKLPEARLAMRVTIWDKVAGTVIKSETIDVATAGVEVTKCHILKYVDLFLG